MYLFIHHKSFPGVRAWVSIIGYQCLNSILCNISLRTKWFISTRTSNMWWCTIENNEAEMWINIIPNSYIQCDIQSYKQITFFRFYTVFVTPSLDEINYIWRRVLIFLKCLKIYPTWTYEMIFGYLDTFVLYDINVNHPNMILCMNSCTYNCREHE